MLEAYNMEGKATEAFMPDLAPGESMTFTRIDTLPGVEALKAYNRGSQWAFVTTTYSIAMPVTWSGEAFCERRTYSVGPDAFSVLSLGMPFILLE